MPMKTAICIQCGAAKRHPTAACKECGFEPRSDEDKAKSIILSLHYELDGVYLGKTWAELLAIGDTIRQGNYQFDSQEVTPVIEYAHRVMSIPARELILDLTKWLGPPLSILAFVYWLIWATK